MIRHSPAEYYLKFLVVSGCDNDQVKRFCDAHDLVSLGDWYTNELRARYQPPNPFLPGDSTHAPTRDFLTREMIRNAFYPEDAMKKALRILEKARIRELVETMMLSGAPHASISYALQQRSRFSCSEKALDLYRHYFWDTDLLDSSDFRALLRFKADRISEHADHDVRKQYGALMKNFHNDPRVVASRLPVSPLMGWLSQISVGVMPRDINIVQVLEGVRTVSTLRAYESAVIGGPQGAGQGQGFMAMADTANRMLETVVKPEDQLREDLMNIALKTSTAQVPVLRQLTAGQHTVDLAPEPKSVDPDAALIGGDDDDEIP